MRESAAVGLLCAAAIGGPLALGATGPWARFALEAAMAVAVALWAVSGRGDWRGLVIPAVVAGLFLPQLMPLPDGLLAMLSPATAGRWQAAHEGLEPAWGTLSVDPAATATAIRRLFLGLAATAAVTSLARSARYRRWFFGSLAVSGALIWGAGVVFPVNPDHRVVMRVFSLHGPIHFWMTPERSPLQTAGCGYLDEVTVGSRRYQADDPIRGDGFGSYIYSNHFATALCLTLPALWATWMAWSARRRVPDAVRFSVLAAVMTLACWTTASWAHSRAGTAALACAALVYVALAAEPGWLRWTASALVVGIAAGLVGFLATCQGLFPGLLDVLPDSMRMKIASLQFDSRIAAAHVAGRMFLSAPVLGVGLGAFGDLYPHVVRGTHTMWFAHNEYAQLLAESGLVGVGLLAVAGVTLIWRCRRWWRERPAGDRVIDAGAWAALAGVATHAVFDWGLHAPANAFLACVVAGLALSSVAPTHATVERFTAPAHLLRGAFAAACLAVTVLLARDAHTEHTLDTLRRATTAARLAMLKTDAPSATPLLRDAIRAGTRAWRFDPGDWRLAALLAQANLHLAHQSDDETERLAAQRACEGWKTQARRSCAVTRGLPEPLPTVPNLSVLSDSILASRITTI